MPWLDFVCRFSYCIQTLEIMNVPAEILTDIASRFKVPDLKNFRLVNRTCASAGLSFIPQNGLSVIDASECMENFTQLLRCETIANNTKKMTILYGKWPICFTQNHWARHPLLFRGNDRSNATKVHSIQSDAADVAFNSYWAFMKREWSRRYYEEVADIFDLLSHLPNLEEVEISSLEACAWTPSLKPQYCALQKRICMSPKIGYDVTPGLEKFLLAFSDFFRNIKKLTITGILNSATLNVPLINYGFYGIQTLQISSFGDRQDEEITRQFLSAFPNLVELSLDFQGWESSLVNIIGELYWEKLSVLRLGDAWVSEEEIFKIVYNHREKLTQLTINCATLTSGSWDALLRRIQILNSKATIILGGSL